MTYEMLGMQFGLWTVRMVGELSFLGAQAEAVGPAVVEEMI